MQAIPLRDYIICRHKDGKQPDKPIIIVPETAAKLAPYGEVLVVGPDCKLTKVGDNVLYLPGNAIAVPVDGENLHFLQETSCFGKYVEVKPKPDIMKGAEFAAAQVPLPTYEEPPVVSGSMLDVPMDDTVNN